MNRSSLCDACRWARLAALPWLLAAMCTATLAAPPPAPVASACDTAPGRRLSVGADQPYPTPSAAAAVAASGDVVLIQAGDYVGDVAVWPQSNLTICGVNGRPRLLANGRSAVGKGIWVVQGSNVVIENIAFHDAKVPDRNGAGIRAEGNGLTVRHSGFYDNENGILGPNAGALVIERSEFARNGGGDGFTHNLYVGRADRLLVTDSFFHEARIGHQLKSRARQTTIERSHFMDGPPGTSSYLVNVPDGGTVVLRGNLLHKGPRADNAILVAYGEEGAPWPVNTLEMAWNTLVTTYPGGRYVQAAASVQAITLKGNLLAGTGGTTLINPDVMNRLTQTANVQGTADRVPGADDLANPRFWPDATLAAQAVLPVRGDAVYVADAPAPYVRRAFSTRAGRRAGALQAPP